MSAPDIPFEIFQTNAISAGQRGTGLFPRTARLNHGCSKAFTAVYSWREAESVLGESKRRVTNNYSHFTNMIVSGACYKGYIQGTGERVIYI